MRRLDDESKRQIEAGLSQVPKPSSTLRTMKEIDRQQKEIKQAKNDLFTLINNFESDDIYDYLHHLYNGGRYDDTNNTSETWLRGRAFEAIIQLPERDPFAFLSEVVLHQNSNWRFAACRAIGQLGERANAKCVGLLCDVLLNDEDADVRFCAARALAEVGDESALPTLRYAETNDKGEDYEGRPISEVAREAVEAILART